MREESSFLDRSTLLALGVLALCWWGWGRYMKQKYGTQPEPVVEQEALTQKTFPKTPQQKTPSLPQTKETAFFYKGKNFDLEVSSFGMGIKKALLKKFSDQKNKTIVFKQKDTPLFATRNLLNKEVLLFKVKKTTKGFEGTHKNKGLVLKKRIIVDDKNYELSVETQILKHPEDFKGLSFDWLVGLKKDQPTEKPWYLRFFLFSLPENLTGFVFSEEGAQRVFTGKTIDEGVYKNVVFGALGSKYFGQAFINKGFLLPRLSFKGNKKELLAEVFYETKHTTQQKINYNIFFGPKDIQQLQHLHPKAQNWIDYGFFGWLARPLLSFLKFLYTLVHNWGFAIILLTFFIRLLLLPINVKSYKSMRAMQKLQKPIQALKEKHKGNPQKLNQEMLALMKENKANPLGGCLPLFLQFPVFFALYRVLGESLELYKAPFVFWITDLSLKDPYYVLPVLGGAVLFAQQKLTPMSFSNKAQERMLTMMPLIFSVFMLGLPSGLTLYIFISGLFGFSQQFFFVKTRQQT